MARLRRDLPPPPPEPLLEVPDAFRDRWSGLLARDGVPTTDPDEIERRVAALFDHFTDLEADR